MSSSLIASVLHLDRRAISALRITDPYSLHRVVYSLFPDVRSEDEKTASKASGIVFADLGGDVRGRQILLLSNRMPQATVDGEYGEVQSKPITDHFLQHDHYRFKVIVNPTRRDIVSKKLVAVRGREAVASWFMERAEASWGFLVDPQHLHLDKIDVLRFQDKHQHSVTMAQAHLQGVLRVSDRAQFLQSFAQGIGRGRAFGTGLLQLVPLIDNTIA